MPMPGEGLGTRTQDKAGWLWPTATAVRRSLHLHPTSECFYPLGGWVVFVMR
jgi:hypothetical protein